MKRTSGTAIATTHHEVPTMMRIGKSFILPALFLALSATAVVGCNDSPFTVAVDRPLRVVYMSPGPSQQNVPLEAQVSVVFSEEVQEAGFKDEKSFSVQEQAGGGWKTIAGSITWDSKSKTLTFKPAAKLRYSATYRIHLGAGLTKVDSTDTSGGHLPGDIDAVFTTVDPPGLGIVSVDTASGKSPMPRDAGGGKPDAVLVRFTEGVKQSSAVLGANVKFEDVTGAADPISGAGTAIAAAVEYLDGQGNAATDAPSTSALIGTDALLKITPSAQPGYGTVVRLTLVAKNAPDLTGIVSDRATARGGQLTACNPTTGYTCAKGDYVFIFKVEELPALSVVSFIPGDPTDTAGAGVQGVAFDQGTITAVFSEDVDCASITWETSGVSFDSTDPVAPSAVIGGTKTCNGATVTFTAEAPFGYSRDVVGTLTTAVRSARSVFDNPAADPLMGHIQSALNYRFSTVNPPELLVISVKPGSGGGSLVSGNNAGTTKDTIVVTFSEGVRRDVEQLGLDILVEDVTGAVPAAVAGALLWNAAEGDNNADLSGKDNLATFTPSANWQFGTKVRVTFVGGTPPPLDKLRSDRATVQGGQLTTMQTYDLAVETIPDLYVKSVTPGIRTDTAGAGAQGVAFDQGTITAVFSEDVDCPSITWETSGVAFDSTDPVAPSAVISGTKTCNGAAVTFTATAPFGYSRDVVGTLTTAVRSARAVFDNPAADPLMGHLQSDSNYRFSTVNPPELLVISVKPGSGGGSL
ncbi:MAG: Ig-like domain-containing protein, partial [Deltaproteobacteria bacterium]|nr:Ig-like domain-containing protein [Deltaproteobacteria bacterium]